MTTKQGSDAYRKQLVRKLHDPETLLNAGKDQAAVFQALKVSEANLPALAEQ